MERDGKVYRNLEGQVAYLTQFLETNALANEMGIKVLGRVDTAADLPANDPDDPFEYGDAYMVGEEGHTPYRMYIWSRDAGDGNPGWFDIGYFPTAPDEFSIVEVNGEPVHVFDADTKLDKATSSTNVGQAYIKNADGTQGMLNMNTDIMAGAIALRLASGGLKVPLIPVADSDATSKKYSDDTFLAKQTGVTSYPQLYGKYGDGSQAMIPTTTNAVAGTVVQRQSNGQITLPNQNDYAPSDDQAISKRYADAHYASGVTHYIHQIIVDVTTTNNYQFKMMVSIINSSNTAITNFTGIPGSSVLSLSITPMEAEDDEQNRIYWSASPYYGSGFPYSNEGLGVSITPSIGAPFIIDGLSGQGSAVSTISIVDTVSQL